MRAVDQGSRILPPLIRQGTRSARSDFECNGRTGLDRLALGLNSDLGPAGLSTGNRKSVNSPSIARSPHKGNSVKETIRAKNKGSGPFSVQAAEGMQACERAAKGQPVQGAVTAPEAAIVAWPPRSCGPVEATVTREMQVSWHSAIRTGEHVKRSQVALGRHPEHRVDATGRRCPGCHAVEAAVNALNQPMRRAAVTGVLESRTAWLHRR